MHIEQKNLADPLAELDTSFRGDGPLDQHERPEDILYRLRDLGVRVSVL